MIHEETQKQNRSTDFTDFEDSEQNLLKTPLRILLIREICGSSPSLLLLHYGAIIG